VADFRTLNYYHGSYFPPTFSTFVFTWLAPTHYWIQYWQMFSV